MSEEGHGHETLIIKRHGGGHHDEHHGGVWKIAFADFMTAMMAFFLVMWLISANDKTKATIAKYFNPIELVDSTPQPVGLNDEKKDDPNVQRKSDPPPPSPDAKDTKPPDKSAAAPEAQGAPKPVAAEPIDEADQSAKHDEMDLIRDPYAVIAEIASKDSKQPPKQSVATSAGEPASGTGAVGLKKGDAFRDPFEPQPAAAGPLNLPADLNSPILPPASPPTPPPASAAAPAPAPATPTGPDKAMAAPPAPVAGNPTPPPAAPPPGTAATAIDRADDKPLPPTVLRSRIASLVKAAGDAAGSGAPKLELKHTDEGTLISLTDSADFSMFGSASARPSASTVALMEKIGRLLKAQKGAVTIRGFTDSRPFHSDTYDNWRLSTERAHIAQYMLMRGGLDAGRIDRIEGYADHRPKNVKDPDAAENRRIEILLRDNAP